MATHVSIFHQTRYQYDRPISLSPHIIRLRPAAHTRTPILGYSLRILPEKHFINWQQDPFGNYLARIVFPEPVSALDVSVEVIADLTSINPFDFFLESFADKVPFAYPPGTKHDLQPYLAKSPEGPAFADFLKTLPPPNDQNTVDWLVAINWCVHHAVAYTIRLEAGVQSCEETMRLGSGSCRDSAWLLAQALRHHGMATRFVSGYLVQLTSDEKSLDGPSGPEKDFTDLHAWTEVYIPGAGWVGLDPTSGLLAGEGHIPLACTPDPQSAAAIEGNAEPCETEFSFQNHVTRIHEDPRVTKPYTDEQWQNILDVGETVEARLVAGDVRLSMGGEPTFVSIDDMDGPEWNITADSPAKRERGYDLLKRLHQRFGPGGVLHIGEGKWYPGEPLPRWAFTCLWRTDGHPLWQNPAWLADPQKAAGHTHADAENFLTHLADRLEVFPEHRLTAFEDVAYHQWKASTSPVNLPAEDGRLHEDPERKHLAKLLKTGLEEPVAAVLPLFWHPVHGRWVSCPWEMRRGKLFLIPGTSAAGLRLPLDSIPWSPPEEKETSAPHSPMEDLPPLATSTPRRGPPVKTDAVTHTSLVVEVREGRLYVFLPPVSRAEHFTDLLSEIEATAAHLQMPVILEGYLPPNDPRLQLMKVTPDPGVIEVNIHPSTSWKQLVENTGILYEEARLARLGTEKFMLDGRHTGTGGGNHITLGSASPADSPFLRNPGLLRSLITYWQHHPALSYLFSGSFIGPTSQAPRVDEGRDDKLYELEIAFSQLPTDADAPPWLVDRILRNLLTDLTGNTHRTEFCIDKLYSPDTTSGRLGILELRAFEMPPHPRMSLLQQLLVRALVTMCWEKPYHKKLVHWGTELHDRFLLPHYVEADMQEIVEDLNAAGFPFELQWFKPFIEFRFPRHGSTRLSQVHLELRHAIEPWNVLGEEATASGTARYVDSSAERLQLKVTGLTHNRHAITCNGKRVPLVPTGTRGEYVAGIRYQAWAPWSALHPTIKPQTPLVFDLVDLWNARSLGGCSYHIAHPGGRNYDTFPVNALEAEARRVSRFWQQGHTQTPPPVTVAKPDEAQVQARVFSPSPPAPVLDLREVEPDPDFPYTFDLRGRS